jgi:outer membrane protein TolC
MRKIIALIFWIGFWVHVVQGQDRAMSFYISRAIDHSAEISAERNHVKQAQVQKDIDSANLKLPKVSATGDYRYSPYGTRWGFDPAITDGGHYSALLNVDYPIFTNQKMDVRNEKSSVVIQESEYSKARIEHDLKKAVSDQYITTYQDQQRIDYYDGIRELLQNKQEILSSLAQEGVIPITEVKQIEIELQKNRIDQKAAENTFENDLLKLNIRCGITDSSTNVILQKPILPRPSNQLGGNTFVQKFKLDSTKVAVGQRLSELKYKPDISLAVNTGLNAVKFTGIQNHFGLSMGVHVAVPIYDGNQRSMTQKQSHIRQQTIANYQHQFERKRITHIASLRRQIKGANEQETMIAEQISQYQELLQEYQKKLKQGMLSVVDYLTVLHQYMAVRQQRIQIQSKRWRLINELQYWNW